MYLWHRYQPKVLNHSSKKKKTRNKKKKKNVNPTSTAMSGSALHTLRAPFPDPPPSTLTF